MFEKISQKFVECPLFLPYLTDFSPQLMAVLFEFAKFVNFWNTRLSADF